MASEDERAELGRLLRQARRSAALTGTELAARLGCSQATISRAESGRTPISPARTTAWLRACEAAAASDTAASTDTTPAATTSTAARRRRLSATSKPLSPDARPRVVRIFDTSRLPVLLQTPEYAALSSLELSSIGLTAPSATPHDHVMLFDPSVQIDVVISRTGLSWKPGSESVLRRQLVRLRGLTRLTHIKVSVLGEQDQHLYAGLPPFTLYYYGDERTEASVRLPTGALPLHGADEVRVYEQLFERQRSRARRNPPVDAVCDALLTSCS